MGKQEKKNTNLEQKANSGSDQSESSGKSQGKFVLYLKRLGLSFAALFLLIVPLEIGLRLTGFSHTPKEKVLQKPTLAGFEGTYEFYVQTRFDPPGYIWIAQPNTRYTDMYGFKRPGVDFEKEGGKVRVAFLGGSTTWGGTQCYASRAIRLLNEAIGEDKYEMLNVGCSSYCTHQSLIALDRWVLPRKPDLAVIFHGWNDDNVMPDGFEDFRKDFVTGLAGKEKSGFRKFAMKLKTTQLLGKILEKTIYSKPKPRVPPQLFRKNLETVAWKFREQGVNLIIMSRPRCNRKPFKITKRMYSPYWSEVVNSDDQAEIYYFQHKMYTDIQRNVAKEQDNASLFDASAVIDDLQERNIKGEFGKGINIFRHDFVHLTAFGDQKMAEKLAEHIAPQHVPQIRNYINSAVYHVKLAKEYLKAELPQEACYHAKTAAFIDPNTKSEMDELIAKAEANFHFVKLFKEGRWEGYDPVYENKMRKLKECLKIRPGDFGVCLQLYRVCIYMSHMPDAAAAMSSFVPNNVQERYQWLNFIFQSHAAGRRWVEAVPVAKEMLKLNPNDSAARSFLQQARAQGLL